MEIPGPGSYNLRTTVSEIMNHRNKIKDRIKRIHTIKGFRHKAFNNKTDIETKVGPGAYNPQFEAIRSKSKMMLIYQIGRAHV